MRIYFISIILTLIGVKELVAESALDYSPIRVEIVLSQRDCDTIIVDNDGGLLRIVGKIGKTMKGKIRITSCRSKFEKYYNEGEIISVNGTPFTDWLKSQKPQDKVFVEVILPDSSRYGGLLLKETDEKISLENYEGDSLTFIKGELSSFRQQEFVILMVKRSNQKIKRVLRMEAVTIFCGIYSCLPDHYHAY